jgi:hypothetical protein
MNGAVREVCTAPFDYWPIALELWLEDGDRADWLDAAGAVEMVVRDSWHFFGYDVADSGPYSGLSNFGFFAASDEGRPALSRRYYETAREFKDFMNALYRLPFDDESLPNGSA